MRVLIACEYSGRVRDAFTAMGHDAVSCDLLESDSPGGVHYKGDVRNILKEGWDLMIAHPPCTYLSVSGLHWNTRGVMVDGRPRAELTEEALEFVRELMFAKIKKIAIENPVSCISSKIRKPDQIIQPYNFGEDASKSTCLWLKQLPSLKNGDYVAPRMVCGCGSVFYGSEDKYGCSNCCGDYVARPRWGNQTDSGQNSMPPGVDRWKKRSTTFLGIARAMAAQWG